MRQIIVFLSRLHQPAALHSTMFFSLWINLIGRKEAAIAAQVIMENAPAGDEFPVHTFCGSDDSYVYVNPPLKQRIDCTSLQRLTLRCDNRVSQPIAPACSTSFHNVCQLVNKLHWNKGSSSGCPSHHGERTCWR